MLAAAAFGVVFIASSGAAPPPPCPTPGNFEIDGDMAQHTCATPADDWNTPGIGVQSTTQGGTYSTSNKDNSDPSNWTSSGSTPNKTDFAQAYATSRVVNGHFYVFVAWERTDTTGTQGYAIEITNAGSSTAPDGTPRPNRTNGGDVFYLSSQGAAEPSFDSACSYHTQSDYGQTCTSSDASVTAAINTAAISDPLNHTTQPAGGFFEVALDVTGLTGITPSCPGTAANTVYLRSITGQTSNGNLKGYMAPLQVAPDSTCVPPPITTTATPGGSTNLPGTTQHDEVTVGQTGAFGVGTVKFFLCSPAEVTANKGDCSANGTQVGSAVTLNSSGFGKSADVNAGTTPADTTPGKYCWRAEFTPSANDHNYLAGSHTNSDTECFKVLATPSIVTSQDPGSGGLGLTYKDKAVLSGGADPTGTITFDLYDNPNCTGTPLDEETASVNGNGTYETPTGVQLNSAGTYYWVASYGGDSSNTSAVAGCADEPVTVAPNQPSIETTPSPSSVTLGTSTVTLKDSAVLSGGSSPTGSITFTLVYKGATVDTETVSVSGNGTYSTPTGYTLPTSGTVTGTYQWNASYSGDGNNKSASESDDPLERVTVGPASPSVVTHASDPATLPGSVTFTDSAVVSGGYGPTGTLTFSLSGPNGFSYTQKVTVSGNGTYHASDGPISNPDAGTYTWSVTYSGDDNNESAVDQGGSDEQTVVSPASPSITTTQAPASGSTGDTYNDSAVLSGGATPSGTITFDLYDNPNCTGQPLDEETVSVANGNGTYDTPTGFQLNSAGTYYWVASYGGDSNNMSAVSGCADEPVVVKGPAIHIVKAADAAQVEVGQKVGFTMTVSNAGSGDAHGVMLTDTLPTNSGLSWSVDKTGAGWGSSGCAIAAGVLTCGGVNGVTVPAGTTQAASTFTVHISSDTTAATGGDCPATGVVDNTGKVSTSNDGSDQSSASTCVQALVDLSVTKTGSPASQPLGAGNITWTMVVKNNGPDADTNVTVSDPMPGGNTFVSATTTKGTCTGGAVLNCSIGPMAVGEQVTITLVTTPSAEGPQVNTVHVVGDRPETNTANNTATATVQVFQGPPPVFCVAVSRVTPKQLFVGRKTRLTIHVTQNHKAVKGIHVRITGPKTNIRTQASNSKGVITRTVKMKKAGILIFSPIASKRCNTQRVGVTNVFTPPVTG